MKARKNTWKACGLVVMAALASTCSRSERQPPAPGPAPAAPRQGERPDLKIEAKTSALALGMLLVYESGEQGKRRLADLAVAFGKAGDLARAAEILDPIARTAKTHELQKGDIAVAYVEAGLSEDAFKFALSHKDPITLQHALLAAAQKLVETGQVEKARGALPDLDKKNAVLLLTAAAERLIKDGRPGEASALAGEALAAREAGADLGVPEIASLGRVCALANRAKDADALFAAALEKLGKKAKDDSTEQKRNNDLAEVVDELVSSGRVEQAEAAMGGISKEWGHQKVTALLRVAAGYGAAGRTDKDRALVEAARKLASGLRPSCGKGQDLAKVAGAYKRRQEAAEADKVAGQALANGKGAKPDGDTIGNCYFVLFAMDRLAEAGLCSRLADAAPLFPEPDDAWSPLVRCGGKCLDAGDKEGGLRTLAAAQKLLEADTTGAETYSYLSQIAGLYARAGDDDRAFELAAKLKPSSRFRPDAYYRILEARWERGKGGTRGTRDAKEQQLIDRILDGMGWK